MGRLVDTVKSAAQAGVSEFSQRCSQSNGGALTVNGDAVYASTTTDDGSDVGGDEISVNLITCGGGSDGDDELFDVNNLGVFYTVEGTDARLRVSACSNQTDFQNRVSVFSSCDSDSCLNSAASENHQDSNVTDICPNANASIVEFQSTLGETYNILVQNENAGQSGNFSLAVEEMQPENVVCQQAMELEMDKTIAGTTAGVGVSSSSVESCNQNNTNSSSSSSTTIGPGVWFYIPAESNDNSGDDNGNYQIIVGTCSMQRMNFWVYNADAGCDEELTCVEVEPQVEGNYSCEDGSPQSLATWFSTKEEGYYVYMFGEEGSQFRIVFTRSLLSNGDSGSRTKQSAINFVVLGSWILALVLWIQM